MIVSLFFQWNTINQKPCKNTSTRLNVWKSVVAERRVDSHTTPVRVCVWRVATQIQWWILINYLPALPFSLLYMCACLNLGSRIKIMMCMDEQIRSPIRCRFWLSKAHSLKYQGATQNLFQFDHFWCNCRACCLPLTMIISINSLDTWFLICPVFYQGIIVELKT